MPWKNHGILKSGRWNSNAFPVPLSFQQGEIPNPKVFDAMETFSFFLLTF
jgi:hypothetical protein